MTVPGSRPITIRHEQRLRLRRHQHESHFQSLGVDRFGRRAFVIPDLVIPEIRRRGMGLDHDLCGIAHIVAGGGIHSTFDGHFQ